MKRITKIILLLISVFSFSCSKEKNELSILEPKLNANDTAWCVPIGTINSSYSFLKYVRGNNTIIQLVFLNPKKKVITSEMYSFDKDENLDYYIVLDRFSKNRYRVQYRIDRRIRYIDGEMTTFLDSIAFSEIDGYTLFYTYPRMPYYNVKGKFYLHRDTIGDVDSIMPTLKNNCHILLKVGNKLPLYVFPVFDYVHFTTKNKFKLGWPSKLDTIKKVPYPKQLDLFYTKEIDYSKYPFVKEEE
jgi:hypothetical protein